MPYVAKKDCTEAIVGYARSVIGRLSRVMVPGDKFPDAFMEERWQRGPDGRYRRVAVARQSIVSAWDPDTRRLEKVRRSVREDPDFAPLIGNLVGDSMGTTPFDESTVIDTALMPLTRMEPSHAVPETEVRQAVDELRRYANETERLSAVIIPLPYLSSPMFPMELEPGVEIGVLGEDEVNVCASTGILESHFGFLSAEQCIGVRIAITTPAIIRSVEEAGTANLEPSVQELHRFGDRSPSRLGELVEDILFVLRLARAEPIGTRGFVHMPGRPVQKWHSWTTRSTRNFFYTSYVIDEQTQSSIENLWRLLRKSKGKSLPSICSRRFNAAMDRISLEDAIVDHLIAAEALLLKDAGSPEDRGELGFRLALRASAFLEPDGYNRLSTFKFMKRAYDLRSLVAHGGNPPGEVSVPGRDKMSLAQFVEELGQIMRVSLTNAAGEYSIQNFGTAAYWDDLLLGPAAEDKKSLSPEVSA